MANPSYYQTSPAVTSMVQHQEHVFNVIMHPRNDNQRNIVSVPEPDVIGSTWVINWEVTDGAMVIGRLQGVAMSASAPSLSWYLSSNLVFTDQRFQGSTLNVQGCLGPPHLGDWAVMGGTGEFTCAQGNISYKTIKNLDPNDTGGCAQGTMELHIRVICLTFPKLKPVQKVGPWGGNGGTAYEIQEADHVPQRLESLTIFDGDVIESIEFSYTDQAGQTRTVGPWGGEDGKSKSPPIQFAASETVMEIYGTTGNYEGRTVLTSLTIVTNVLSYGPYGKHSRGNSPFHVSAPKDQSVVGFYGRADGSAVNQIGVYVICPN